MIFRRRELLAASAAALAATMQGCASTSRPEKSRHYWEAVAAIYVSVDHKLLVVMGSDYHYVFDMPPAIDAVLSSAFRQYVQAIFDHGFAVDPAGGVMGDFTLRVNADVPETAQKSAVAAGYKLEVIRSLGDTSLSKEYAFQAHGTFRGTRYAANGFKPPEISEKLNRSYQVYVTEELPARDRPVAANNTPVTVGNDGLGIAFGALLIVPMAIAVGVGSATGRFP